MKPSSRPSFGSRKNSADPAEAPALQFEAMEPRVLYSAVPTDPIEGPADDSAIQVQDVAPAEFVTEDGDIAPSEGVTESEAPIPADHSLTPQDDATDRATEDSLIQQINTSTENTALTGRHEIVFISTDVYDYEYLASHLNPNLELVFIDATQDGMERMATALEGRTGIDAIHLLTHGSAGELQVGNAILDATSMSGEYADELAAIGAALSEDGDFLIYGCNFAAGETGAAAAGLIASLTGADVAASTDNTGGDLQGGNWILENKIGSIEAETITDSSWRGILVPGDNDNDGISDFYDIDDDNDGITDDEESGTVQVNLNVVTSIPAGAIPGNPAGMRLSDASGNYVVDIVRREPPSLSIRPQGGLNQPRPTSATPKWFTSSTRRSIRRFRLVCIGFRSWIWTV